MNKHKPDKKEDKNADPTAEDRGESVSLMEPLLIAEGSKFRTELTDLAVELAARSAGFRRSLPDGVLEALSTLVRAMNCYYSNLIEGHDTHPVDIEKALKNDYSTDTKKRNLQLEAKAHIAVQKWIDEGGLRNNAATLDGICEIHRRFCELLPDELLWVEDPETGKRRSSLTGVYSAVPPMALGLIVSRKVYECEPAPCRIHKGPQQDRQSAPGMN